VYLKLAPLTAAFRPAGRIYHNVIKSGSNTNRKKTVNVTQLRSTYTYIQLLLELRPNVLRSPLTFLRSLDLFLKTSIHHAVAINCQRNSGYRLSRVNIMAQGLSTPDPSLSHTDLSIRR